MDKMYFAQSTTTRWSPTMQLRWWVNANDRSQRILQQKWIGETRDHRDKIVAGAEEWRAIEFVSDYNWRDDE